MRWQGIGILEQPNAAPVPPPAVWVPATDGSTFTGTSAFYAAPPYGTVPDTVDCYFDIPNAVPALIATTGVYIIPPGEGYFVIGAVASTAITLQIQSPTLGTWVTIQNFAAAGGGGVYKSDGINVRLANTGASPTIATTIVLYPVR